MKTATKTRFSDIVLDDANISMAAKGLFLTLGFLGNSCTLEQLKAHCADSEADLRRILEELRRVEYISLEGEQISVKAAASFGVGEALA
jgi:hypothetical protein